MTTPKVDALMARLTAEITPARRRALAVLVEQADQAEPGKRYVHVSVATRRPPFSASYSVNQRVAQWLVCNQLAQWAHSGFYVRLLPFGRELHNRLEGKPL